MKRIKTALCLAFIAFFLTFNLFAQTEIPVDLATGKPQISIPIFDLKERDIVIPFGLDYDAKGVRVNDVGDWKNSENLPSCLNQFLKANTGTRQALYIYRPSKWWNSSYRFINKGTTGSGYYLGSEIWFWKIK